jgi:hypothetical protein
MTAAIKTTVAELLPILVAHLESDLEGGERAVDSDGTILSLCNSVSQYVIQSIIRL